MTEPKDEIIERMKSSIDRTIKDMMEDHFDEMSKAIDITRQGVIDFLESDEGKEFIKEITKKYITEYADNWLPDDEAIFELLNKKIAKEINKFKLVIKEK